MRIATLPGTEIIIVVNDDSEIDSSTKVYQVLYNGKKVKQSVLRDIGIQMPCTVSDIMDNESTLDILRGDK